jgi:hypothetical protein
MTKTTKALVITLIIVILAGLGTYLSGGNLLGRMMRFETKIPTVYKMEQDTDRGSTTPESEIELDIITEEEDSSYYEYNGTEPGEVGGYDDGNFGPEDD